MVLNSQHLNLKRVSLFALLSVAWAPMAQAQEATDKPSGTIVPASTATLDETDLDARGVLDLADFANLVPAMSVTTRHNESLTTARIRGIGSMGDNAGLESSVGLFVDGVGRSRTGMGFGNAIDIERVEVLRGPQDVLLGRNTPAGAIQVITKRPTRESSFEAEAGVGTDGFWGVAAAYSGGLGDLGAIRISGSRSQRDGFIDVRTGSGPRLAGDDGDYENYAFRGQLLIDPNDSFSALLSVDYSDRNGECCAGVTVVRGPSAPYLDVLSTDEGVAPSAAPFARTAWSDQNTTQSIEDFGGSLTLEWTPGGMGGVKLTSVTALRQWKVVAGEDLDHSSANLFHRNATESDNMTKIRAFSQDLRLSANSSKLDWMVGVSWSDERLDRNEGTWIGSAYEPFLSIETLRSINPVLASSPTAPLFFSQASARPFGTAFAGHASADSYRQKSSSLALFTNNTWHATDRLDLNLGFRYTFDDKQLTSSYSNPNGGLACAAMLANPAQVVAALVARGLSVAQASAATPGAVAQACAPWTNNAHNGRLTNQDTNEGEWAGSIRATYRLDDSTMVYASATRGYKAGGFNLDRMQSNTGLSSGSGGILAVNDTSFAQETVESYEIGVSAGFGEGKGRFDLALFHQRHSGFQLTSIVSNASFIRSVPEVTATGFDAAVSWRSGGFRFRTGVSYADTRYGDAILPGADLLLLPGSQLSHAPQWTITSGIGYAMPLGNAMQLEANLGGKYLSEHNTSRDLNPLAVQDSYVLVDARIGLGRKDKGWTVEFWVHNLTDVNYLQESYSPPLQVGSVNAYLGAPRTYGLTVKLGL
jgi:iron complex outermembrane recepter protein